MISITFISCYETIKNEFLGLHKIWKSAIPTQASLRIAELRSTEKWAADRTKKRQSSSYDGEKKKWWWKIMKRRNWRKKKRGSHAKINRLIIKIKAALIQHQNYCNIFAKLLTKNIYFSWSMRFLANKQKC